jgi:putative exosortase-associated protein (TIGR04073 family)
MRSSLKSVALLASVAAILVGCTHAEQKLGRGLVNVTEPFRLGEYQAAYEEGVLFGGPNGGVSGAVRGVGRTIGRTVVGVAEIVSFPIPSKPYFKPDGAVYPDSYHPGPLETSTLSTDRNLGFEASDAASIIPGSRFRVFE